MKKIFSKIIFALLLIPMIFFASACGDGDETVQENVEKSGFLRLLLKNLEDVVTGKITILK